LEIPGAAGFVNQGTLRVEGAVATFFDFHNTAEATIEIGEPALTQSPSSAAVSVLFEGAAANLDGQLIVDASATFDPQPGQSFPLLAFPAVVGDFSSVTFPALAPGRTWTTSVGATAYTISVNGLPTANAGGDQDVFVGDTVALDGSGSTDPDGDSLTFSWRFTTRPPGSSATLSGAVTATPTFVVDVPGTYEIELSVSDAGGSSAPTTVLVGAVINEPPLADAGSDQQVILGDLVVLDGSGTTDPEGDVITFAWKFVTYPSGSAAVLGDTDTAQPSFLTDLPGTYKVQLIASDERGSSVPVSVLVTTLGPDGVIDRIHTFIDTFGDEAFKSNGRRLFEKSLDAILKDLTNSNLTRAAQRAGDLRTHVDGCADTLGTPSGNDWVTECGVQLAARSLVDGLIRTISAQT